MFETWESAASVPEFVNLSVHFVGQQLADFNAPDYRFFPQLTSDLSRCWQRTSLFDCVLVAVLIGLWSLGRHLATKHWFEPFSARIGLSKSNAEKVPESGWRFIYYVWSFLSTSYVIFFVAGHGFVQQPSLIWKDYSLATEPIWPVYLIYAGVFSFYVHASYSAVFLDAWRKDSLVMVVHHVITAVLVAFSYTIRAHNIGIFVLFCHDFNDIFLEAAKVATYCRVQHGKPDQFSDRLATGLFLIFTTTWLFTRFYWYPLKGLYSIVRYVPAYGIAPPFPFFLTALLFCIFAMDVYWTFLILKLLYKVVIGEEELDDIREYDSIYEQQKLKSNQLNGTPVKNGLVNGKVKKRN